MTKLGIVLGWLHLQTKLDPSKLSASLLRFSVGRVFP